MGPTAKASPASGNNARPKKIPKTLIVKLTLSPDLLVKFDPVAVAKEPIVKKLSESKVSSSSESNTLPATISSPGENGSESNANTPAPSAAEDSTSMPPPSESVKKSGKGVKRTSIQADGLLKPRGKPGPKKRAKLEDGITDSASLKVPNTTLNVPHKLGPKANQGAINAGLRALDRSGKPCRKWQQASFKVKSFTGSVWEIPRWQAPAKVSANGETGESTSEGSSKENKDSSQVDSEKSNSGADIEMASVASMNPSSPAPGVTAAA